jgi:hypothetical protein
MTDNITLPPWPEPRLEQHELELWGQNVCADLYDGNQMHAFARAAVLLDRQQRALRGLAEADRALGLDYADKPAPSAKPVAWLYQHGETGRTRIVMPDQVFTNGPNQWLMVGPLYQHPPAPLQPVAWLDEEHDCAYTRAELDGGSEQWMRPLYAAPPDHLAVMRQALDALETIPPGGADLNQLALTVAGATLALRKALEEK